jgi:hypothetical protein
MSFQPTPYGPRTRTLQISEDNAATGPQGGSYSSQDVLPNESSAPPATPNQKLKLVPERQRPKKEKRERPQAPADAYIPKRGWPALVYQFNRLRGHADQVPEPRGKEQRHFHIAMQEARLRWLVQILQLRIVVIHPKGGAGKTTTTLGLGSVIAQVGNRSTIALPATRAKMTATLGMKAGIPQGDTLTMGRAAHKLAEIADYRSISGFLPQTNANLYILSEDQDGSIQKASDYGLKQFKLIADTIRPSFNTTIFDGGNDDIEDGSIVVEAMRMADVAVFTGTAFKPDTLELLAPTIGVYTTDLAQPGTIDWSRQDQAGLMREETEIPTREKANNSLVVVSGLKRGQKPDDFVKYLSRRDKSGRPVSSQGFEGTYMTVPYDRRLEKEVVFDLHKIKLDTYTAYLDLAVAVHEKAARLRGIDLTKFNPPTARHIRKRVR